MVHVSQRSCNSAGKAFHCEVYARPQIVKRRGELTKQDMLAMALQMYQNQLKQHEVAEAQHAELADESKEHDLD